MGRVDKRRNLTPSLDGGSGDDTAIIGGTSGSNAHGTNGPAGQYHFEHAGSLPPFRKGARYTRYNLLSARYGDDTCRPHNALGIVHGIR
jgi:hypothetical protein